MSTLESTRQELLKTEQQLARLRGERDVIEGQLVKAREGLAGLGVAEAEVPAHLKKLSAEAEAILSKITELESELNNTL